MVDHITYGTRTPLCRFMEWLEAPSAMVKYHPSSLKAYQHCQQSEEQSCQIRGRVHGSPSKTVNIGQLWRTFIDGDTGPKAVALSTIGQRLLTSKVNSTMCLRLRMSYSHESMTRGNRWLLNQHNKQGATVVAGTELNHQPIPSPVLTIRKTDGSWY